MTEIIVGAELQTFDAIVDGVARAQDQDRRAGLAVADFLQHREAVHVGQHEVENDEVVLGAMHQLDRCGAVAGHVDRVTGAFQAAGQEVLNAFFVFDDEDSHKFGRAAGPGIARVRRLRCSIPY